MNDQVQPLLGTLKDLVAVESGSTDTDGLAKMAEMVSARLQAAGMKTETIAAKAPDFDPQLKGAKVGSMVYGTKVGTGKRSVLLIAHIDTVYTKGMGAQQPFRVDGDRAYGLGISDDKGGVALILHTVKLLQDMGFSDYSRLGVLINGDEEIGSPGSGAMLTQLGSELDFYRSRPAFVANDVSRVLARHAVTVFKEMGGTIDVRDRATGGGTDAAFAGLRPKRGVLESFGLRGFGAPSNDNEYIFISSIAPRLCLSTRMVMHVGSGALSW